MATLTRTIPSYLYEQFQDDDDLQAFVAAQNELTQRYVNTFNALSLPVYTGPLIAGALLDWVALGLYGMARPVLPSGRSRVIGPYNTFQFNQIPFNAQVTIGPTNYYATNDDTFKRILTWHFFKGDGKVFDIRWLKRRIMRFLVGVNGTAPDIDETYQISVTFGVGNQVNIRIVEGIRTVTGGAIFGNQTFLFNAQTYNGLQTVIEVLTPIEFAPIFAAAVEAGVLELPFQFEWVVIVQNPA